MGGDGVGAGVLDAIGGTPLVALAAVVPPGAARLLVKLEGGNPTGSYKDRLARAVVLAAEADGRLAPGQPVVEYTGGSTGSSLALVCAVTGHPLTLVSSDAFAAEKLRTMAALGADVRVVPSDGGRLTPDLFARMREEALRLRDATGAWWVDQFHNTDALVGYAGLGEEVAAQVAADGGRVDVLCAGVGTAGMLVGAARALRARGPLRVVALEPASAPLLTRGRTGAHRVEGIATGSVPPLLAPGDLDGARTVDEGEARALARRLAREEGLFAGTSTAVNVLGALAVAAELGPGSTVVTVACDTGLKYLAGDLFAA
ncbi:PLP-dependent cysteine synthase family protein [Cellulomonas endophytica]|uniref:PLP-dependent cysteine synthase family protein n=1 Tax=Cellulomonas endophytica TaxID=2494735 RepID=UPI0010132E07|nr:cysteine synthase family protein [Cellulomonas endophytica]